MAQPEEVPHGWTYHRLFRMRADSTHRPQFKKGDLVKVVMVSRFGDCGLTKDVSKDYGYDLRVRPSELEPLEPPPADVCPKCHYENVAHDAQPCAELARSLAEETKRE